MSLFRRFFYRKPPDGLLEISERVYVFRCCFTTDVLNEYGYKVYMAAIVAQLRDHLPDASYMAFNFREGDRQSHITNILSEYDMTVVDYPCHYEGCPLLTMGTIHHLLRSSESWLSLCKQNVLLLHCEQGGWPVLAFMLSALLIYRKQYTSVQKALDMTYKQAPLELLQLLSPLNPLPSQLRYLQYISRRNLDSEWLPIDRALTLDCIILHVLPDFDREGGCRPFFRIYGQDPFMASDQTIEVLFPTPKKSKTIRLYKQVDCELVKIDIHCHVQGDVVLECINLDEDLEREEMMFRVMFNTAFISSNILMLSRDEIDILWNAKDNFSKDFKVEVLFSEVGTAASVITDMDEVEEKEGLPLEAFAKAQEILSHVDWPEAKGGASLHVLQQIASPNGLQKKLNKISPQQLDTDAPSLDSNPDTFKEISVFDTRSERLLPSTRKKQGCLSPRESSTSKATSQSIFQHDLQVAFQIASQPKILPPEIQGSNRSTPVSYCNSLQSSPAPISRYHSAPSSLGITTLLHDHCAYRNIEVVHSTETSSLTASSTPAGSKLLEASVPKILSLLPSPCSLILPTALPSIPSSTSHLPDKGISLSIRSSFSVSSPPNSSQPSYTLLPLSSPQSPTPSAAFSKNVSLAPPPPLLPHLPPPPSIATSNKFLTPPPPLHPQLAPQSTSISTSDKLHKHPPPLPTQIASPPSVPTSDKLTRPPNPPPYLAPPSSSNSTSNKFLAPPPPPPPHLAVSSTLRPPPPPLTKKLDITTHPPQPPPLLHCKPAQPSTSPPTPPPSPSTIAMVQHEGLVSQKSSPVQASPLPPLVQCSLKSSGIDGIGAPIGNKQGSLIGSPSPRNLLSTQATSKKASLKPLHWVKVTRAMHGSLWAESQKHDEASKAPEFDVSELESLFSAALSNLDGLGSGERSSRWASLGQKPDRVHLVDLRRANNCEIMLTKVKMPLPDLMSSLLALDDSILDVDQVDNLIKFCPTKEEMELLKGFSGDKERLGKCEQYFLELMKVPRVESKLRVFSFKIQFHSQVVDLKNSLNIVNSATEEIRNSIKLKTIMHAILSLGNALNQGTARGSAIGFRLDSLLKLTDIRARNNKMTLMHYLCKVLADKMPVLLDFSEDLVSLETAAKIQFKTLAEEMQAISKGLEKVEQEFTLSENDGPVSQIFHKTLKEFLIIAEAEVRALSSLYSRMGRNADALAHYFGEDSARCPFEQVVSTLLNFVKLFVRAHEENCKQFELEMKKARKEAESLRMKINPEKMKTSARKKEMEKLPQSLARYGNIR